MIKYSEADKIIAQEFNSLKTGTEEIDLTESTNRILCEDIYSDTDLPPFTNSAMDGFAVQFSPEIKKFKIIGEISAGNYRDYEIEPGLAVGIMTGSKLPVSTDTVIPIEDVVMERDSLILKDAVSVQKGMNVRYAGNDLLKGEIAVSKNTLLKPRHVAVAASCGKNRLKVYKKIKIGVLATGDELIEVSDTPADDKIRCSNLYSLLSAVDEINQTGINLGIMGDNKEEIAAKLNSFLKSNIEILITTGGVSVGKYDYVRSLFEELGIKIHFLKVNIKPGKPVVFGTYKNGSQTKFLFGLPGNPVSSLISFIIFIKRNILKRFGVAEDNFFSAEVSEHIRKRDGKMHFLYGFCYSDAERNLFVKRVGLQSSGNLAEMGKSNCLIIFDEDKKELKPGEKVICIPM